MSRLKSSLKFGNYISELHILRFSWLQLPLYGCRRYLKFIGSTNKFDILISLNPLRFIETKFFKVAYSNTKFHNGNANFRFHNPILLKYYQNFVLPLTWQRF